MLRFLPLSDAVHREAWKYTWKRHPPKSGNLLAPWSKHECIPAREPDSLTTDL
jgi:hypothetical protein